MNQARRTKFNKAMSPQSKYERDLESFISNYDEFKKLGNTFTPADAERYKCIDCGENITVIDHGEVWPCIDGYNQQVFRFQVRCNCVIKGYSDVLVETDDIEMIRMLDLYRIITSCTTWYSPDLYKLIN